MRYLNAANDIRSQFQYLSSCSYSKKIISFILQDKLMSRWEHWSLAAKLNRKNLEAIVASHQTTLISFFWSLFADFCTAIARFKSDHPTISRTVCSQQPHKVDTFALHLDEGKTFEPVNSYLAAIYRSALDITKLLHWNFLTLPYNPPNIMRFY